MMTVCNHIPIPDTGKTVRELISAGRISEALEFFDSNAHDLNEDEVNLKAVCLLRLNRPGLAATLLGPQVLNSQLMLRSDAKTVVIINFATALLMSWSIDGCEDVLDEISLDGEPAVQRLRRAITRLRNLHHNRLCCVLDLKPRRFNPLVLDFLPGVLESDLLIQTPLAS